ncbi:MAG: lipopolysaccharide kinase InaA family protein [Desulfosalsimonas sp.]
MTLVQKYRSFRFGSPGELLASQMDKLVEHFHNPVQEEKSVLGGRIRTGVLELEDTGPVVIKPYFRGGIMARLNKRTYLGIGKARSRAEFEILRFVRRHGINAPEPVAYAVKGWLLYRAWLVTKQIPDAVSLSELSFTDPGKAEKVLPAVSEQIGKLIRLGIYHVDLHPGNVLVGPEDRAFLIDFDRAKSWSGNHERLKQRYVKRWKRAADKHGLPGFIREALEK